MGIVPQGKATWYIELTMRIVYLKVQTSWYIELTMGIVPKGTGFMVY